MYQDKKAIAKKETYGKDADSEFLDIYDPNNEAKPKSVVVLYHGGFFKEEYPASFGKTDDPASQSYMEALAQDLVKEGSVAVVAEYLRVPTRTNGGEEIPKHTAEEMIQSVYDSFDHVKKLYPEAKITVIGHSAGGYYVSCLAMRKEMSEGLGLTDGPTPETVVSMAPVMDLFKAQHDGLSDENDAVARFVSCGKENEAVSDYERYKKLSPMNYELPEGSDFYIVHGAKDTDVPVVGQSDEFARKNPGAKLQVLPDSDHYSFLNPEDHAWKTVAGCIPKMIPIEGRENKFRLR